jgi:hypothetical protein
MCSRIYTLGLRLDLPRNLVWDCRSVTITFAELVLLFCIIQNLTVCTISSKVHGTGSQIPLSWRIVLELGFSSVRPNFLYIVLLCSVGHFPALLCGCHTIGAMCLFLGCCGRPLAGGVASQFDSVTELRYSTLAILSGTRIIGSQTDIRTI